MKYVQINSFYNGSTGTIMRNLHKELQEQGHDSYIFWGRRHETISDHEACCASKSGVYVHGVLSRLTDRAGFYSKRDTRRLLKKLDEIDPDVVHLHNIHGYYINVEMLFEWLARHRCQVKWTLHDCWAFTGHCSYFTYVDCDRWSVGCRDCPQKSGYPKSVFLDSSARNFQDKKRLFSLVPIERMKIVTPSQWLASLVSRSFLSQYPMEIVHNTVDTRVFRPTPSDFAVRHNLGGRKIVLGVANPWSDRKGLDDMIELASLLPDPWIVAVVGLTKGQINRMPSDMLALGRTSSARELAEIYSAARVFVNPTREDNFPTVNLEAEACGTPVITYDVGGCRETISLPESSVVTMAPHKQMMAELSRKVRSI